MSVFCFQFSQAQIFEIGVFAGGSNFIGDVGATNYISPNQFANGIAAQDMPGEHLSFTLIYWPKIENLMIQDENNEVMGLTQP